MVGAIQRWTKEKARQCSSQKGQGALAPSSHAGLSSGREAGFPSLSVSSSWASTRKVRLLTECLRTTANTRRALPSRPVLLYAP